MADGGAENERGEGALVDIRARCVPNREARNKGATCTMSEPDRAKQSDLPPCPRCKAQMQEVLRIAPVLSDGGLIAYECPKYGQLTSVLQPAR